MPRTAEGRSTPTLPDVARAAGVSTATAARALGGYGSVRPETRRKVQAAAADLGYRANGLARSLITGSTDTIGVVLADIENSFFARALRGIADTAHAAGFEVVLVNSDEDLDNERNAVRVLTEKRVDGLVVCPADARDISHLRTVHDAGIPLVLLDRRVPRLAADVVGIDNHAAAQEATAHLIAAGHTRVALLTGGDPSLAAALQVPDLVGVERLAATTVGTRAAGYRDALLAAGLPVDPVLVSVEGFHRADAAAATHRLLGLPEPPTAILALDSLLALGVLQALRERGLTCPDDLSVIGFDDAEWALVSSPPLTVVAQPVYEIGAEACRLLLRRMHGGAHRAVRKVLPTSLIVRGSVGAPARTRRSPASG
ncbi:LacI family transcriptional regulator [Planosporangium thailandense]|uniref:LacI family transcriptional regulator n=1 Tax=Planosporangium thailandense TaxID=765197 RepID=A0ABX0XXG0_9ACTN|nr:LacI family transcriptional regulator [Planosporangium thailandense]